MVIRSVQSRREAVLALQRQQQQQTHQEAAADAPTAASAVGGGPASPAPTTAAAAAAADALSEASSHGVIYKVAGDSRSALTEADGASQRVIVECLRHCWGDRLNIVGEEDDDGDGGEGDDKDEGGDKGDEGKSDVFERYGVPRPTDVPLHEDLLPSSSSSFSSNSSNSNVPLSSVTIYVDPMDGTREFVDGRLGNVQCLVGIVVDGVPVGGVVGLPFPGGRTESMETEGADGGAGGGGSKRGSSDGDDEGCFGPVQIVYALLPSPLPPTSGDGDNDGGSASAAAVLGRLAVKEGEDANAFAFDDIPFFVSTSGSSRATDTAAADNDTSSSSRRRLTVLSGDSKKPEKDIAIGHLRDICAEDGDVELDLRVAGGCGNKMMQVAMNAVAGNVESGGDAIAVMPRGTCSWDTAAPTAVLGAALRSAAAAPPAAPAAPAAASCPGLVTDFNGNDLVYNANANSNSNNGADVTNALGVLASSGKDGERWHRELCRRLEADEEWKRISS